MTPLQQAQAALDSGQMTPAEYALAVKQINDATQSGLPVTAPVPAAPAPAPTPVPGPAAGGGAPVPPGVTPSVWAQLSPGAQAVAAARIAQQGHPFTPGTQPPRMQQGTVDETGGGLKMAGASPVSPPGAIDPSKVVTGASGASAPSGVTSEQGTGLDPAAALLRPGAGTAAHRVGYSPADLAMLDSQKDQATAAKENSIRQSAAVQKIADTFAGQSQATADDAKAALLRTQEQQADNARREAQLAADTKAAQQRVQAKLADLEASGVDPNKYYTDQTTPQRILGAVAVAFGALGAHALGPNGHDSVNTALEITNAAIARNIDAQKTNMQHQLAVLGKHMDLTNTNFDQQKAMLEAERESIQTSYALASNAFAKQAAQYKDNADIQMTNQKVQAGLADAAAEKIGQANAQIYSIGKNAERVVGGGGPDVAKMIRDETIKDREAANAAGTNPTSAELHDKAIKDLFGANGGSPSVDISKPQKGPKTERDAKAEEEAKNLDAAEKNIDDLIAMRSKGSKDLLGAGTINPNETASAKALSLAARANLERGLGGRLTPALLKTFNDAVPEDPLQIHTLGAFGSDPTMARLKEAKEIIRSQRGGSAPTATPPPPGFTPRSAP